MFGRRRSPQHDRAARPSRRKRILRIALAALAVLFVARFFGLRATDRTAWPAPAPGVRLEPAATGGRIQLIDPAKADAILAALPPATNAPIHAYRVFQAGGLDALSPEERAAIDMRLDCDLPGIVDWEAGAWPWNGFFGLMDNSLYAPSIGFAPNPDGAARYAEMVGRFSEAIVLFCYCAQSGDLGAAFKLRSTAARNLVAGPLFHGAGLPGRAAALQCVSLLCRETLMACADWPVAPKAETAQTAIERLRQAESYIVDCAEALREDRVSILAAVHAIYTGEGGENLAAAAGGETPQGLHGFGGWVVRRLGGTEEATRAHLDALFSRLIANAENPYTPDGLVAGLPDWCRLKKRTPWTRDPVGSAIAAAYLRHAIVAAAVDPTLRLELRAARVAIALRLWKDAHGGAYPATLDELASGEKPLLVPADFADPFAPDGAPLRYGRDGDGWRFWSVGLDGRDGGGARDAFTAPPGADTSDADLVFTSRERDIRRAALDAAVR